MVVDDEADDRELIAMVLRRAGAAVSTAGSVSEAMLQLKDFEADVLVTDIGMPNHDGYELLRQVRALDRPPVHAIALTAYGRPEDRARALDAGFQLHLAKPITPAELVAAIAKMRAVDR